MDTNTQLCTFDTFSSTTGGFSFVASSVPRNVLEKVPKAIKVLDGFVNVPTALLTRLISPVTEVANNHVLIEAEDGGTSVDVYFPNITRTGGAGAVPLPATNTSLIGPNPIATMTNLATFITAYINTFVTPIIGATITCGISGLAVNIAYVLTSDTPVYVDFAVYDSIGPLIGFGSVRYHVTESVNTYPNVSEEMVISPGYIYDLTLYNSIYEGNVFIVSNLVSGTAGGVIDLDGTLSSKSVIASVPFYTGGPFRLSEVSPFIEIEHGEFAETIRDKTTEYKSSDIITAGRPVLRFWLKFPSGLPIDNSFSYGWHIRFLFSFSEPTERSLRII